MSATATVAETQSKTQTEVQNTSEVSSFLPALMAWTALSQIFFHKYFC